jgi:TrbC/VIRB2 pilin
MAWTRPSMDGLAQESRGRREDMKNIKKLTVLLVVAAIAMAATPAFAQTGDDPYRTGGENVAGEVQGTSGGGGTVPSADTGGSLPFTGLDLALILAVGGALVAVGFATRRITRPADPA